MKINKDIYFFKKFVAIVLNKENLLNINFKENYLCTCTNYPIKDFLKYHQNQRIELCNVIFNKEIINKILITIDKGSNGIEENCKECKYYKDCKKYNPFIRNTKQINNKIKEFKEFIQNIIEFD